MTVRQENKSWFVDMTVEGKRRRLRSPENTRAGARAYELVLRQRLARGEPIGKAAGHKPPKEQTFAEFAPKWFEDYVVPNNKFSEQRHKKYILSASLVPFFGKMPVGEIGAHLVERYKASLLKDGLSRKTVNNRLTVLNKLLSTAYEWLGLPGTPPKFTWLKCPPPKFDHLSPEECGLLLSHADGVIRDMILTALRTGMRQGELKGLQWSSVDWQNQSVAVRHSRSDYTKQLDSPKSNRERYIPMDADVYTVLFNRRKSTGYVFLDVDGQPFDNKRLIRRLAKACKEAGLRKIGWHTLRHTFASHLAMRGVPLNAVQALMGHSTITTTMRYAHLAPSALRSAIDMLNPKTMFGGDVRQYVGSDWIRRQQEETTQKTEATEKPYLAS